MSPRIKICGLTRFQDAQLASELGAWALGFIFHKKSPRWIKPEDAGKIVEQLGTTKAKTVGVFVDASMEEIVVAVKAAKLSTVQLHGAETPGFCAGLSLRLAGVGLIKALRPRNAEDLKQIPSYARACEAVLLDSYVANVLGGTGVTGDWGLVAQAAQGKVPVILAGGLTPLNIRDALRTPGIFAIDASSGVEEAPGLKSGTQLKAFFKNAKDPENRA